MTSELSRRELLAAFLGLPGAVAACKARGGELPPGELAFPSDALGHRVRDGVPSAPSAWESAKVVIVGGGVAGLSAAWRLARSGFEDFVLLELDPVPGGTAKSGENAVSAYPWGAHYITVPMKENRALIALLSETGVVEGTSEEGEPIVREELLCREPQERLFHEGRWYPGLYLHEGASPDDRAQLARFQAEVDRLATLRDGRGRRAFAIPVATSSDDPDLTVLDREPMAEWLWRSGFTSERLLWMVDYACRDDYGSTPAETSAWAGLFYFAARVERGGREAQAVVTWPEGNGRLVAHLARGLGPRVRLGAAVYDIVPRGEGPGGGVDVSFLVDHGTRAAGIHADQVIFCAPQFVAKRVLAPYREEAPAHVAEFDHGSWMVANLTLRERPRGLGLPFAWDNVLRASPSLGYVVATHQRCVDHGPTVVTYYYPLVDADTRKGRTRLASLGRDEWAEIALADLEQAHPEIRRVTARLDVTRWGHAMIRPRVGLMWGGARAKAMSSHRNVHFANAELSGVALFEEAFDHGVRAAEEVLRVRGWRGDTLR